MLSVIFEHLYNAFDPLYVDDRCELEKQKDKEGTIVVSLSLGIALGIAYLVEVVFK
jgi:hypothetical protein